MRQRRLLFLLGLFLLFASPFVQAQKPSIEPKVFTGSDGKLYWNKALPVYLRLATTPEDKGVLLNSENHKNYVNPLYLDTEGVNYIRTRYAVDQQTKEMVIPRVEVLMEVYADGTSPGSYDQFKNAPEYNSTDGVRYLGQGLKVSLSSNDNLSGVNKILFSTDGQVYTTYQSDISFDKEGEQTLHFFSVDNVGNTEIETVRNFTVDLTAPRTFHNVNGIAEDYIIALSSTIYLTKEDNLSGVKNTYYRFDDEDFRLYEGKLLQMSYLTDGEHTLNYYSVDQVENKEEVKSFKFYFDKTAPITVADVLGDRYISKEKVYLSGRTKMKLTAVDNKAGVKEIRYSIDGGEFQVYDKPFYLPSLSGTHVVRYYSIDNLSNQTVGRDGSGYEEFKHNVSKVYLDLTGPDIAYSYNGAKFETRDTLFINKSTQIQLSATDAESGLQYIAYSLDGASEETKYDAPFQLDKPGLHNIEVFGYDNVSNRNVKAFFCFVDGEPPKALYNFSIEPIAKREGLDVYPSYVLLYLASTDKAVGAEQILYQINQAAEKEYSRTIRGFEKNTRYTIKVKVLDLLGNEQEEIIEFYTGE